MTPPTQKPAGFRKQVLMLLGERYSEKTLVLCPTVFVRMLQGDHKAAILLSQMLYWSDRTKDQDGWFYKSYAEWQLETGLSEAQVRRIVNGDKRVQAQQITLRDLGVETRIKKVRHTGAPTLHYRINQPVFLAALDAFIGAGDPQHCAGSSPDNAQHEPPTLSGMNADQNRGSLIPPETASPDQQAEDHHPQIEDDLSLFHAYADRFGKLKDGHRTVFRSELARLGVERVGQVLARCATRGRSWSYVQRALANEFCPEARSQLGADERWAGTLAFPEAEGPDSLDAPGAARQPLANTRVYRPWNTLGATMLDAWSALLQQFEAQLDRSAFDFLLRDAILVDFDTETQQLVVAIPNDRAQALLEQRYDRLVQRIVKTVVGAGVQIRFVTTVQWAATTDVASIA